MCIRDRFNYIGAIDSNIWTHEIGNGEWGWGNGESQYYTSSLDNVRVEDGLLKITAKREDIAGYDVYAKQISSIFQNNLHVLENVIDALFHVAKADGPINKNEVIFLEKIAGIFGFSSAEFSRIRASHMAADIDDPWLILGLDSGSSLNIAKSQWKKLAAENHPDRLISKGVPKELLGMANEKLAVINSAYRKIEKAHKMKAGTGEI